jgi:uncharacterized protein DUF6350
MSELQPPARPSSAPLRLGWKTAVLRALLAAAVMLVLAESVIILAYFGADQPSKPSGGSVARYGGVLFYAFHHVGFRFDSASVLQGGAPFNIAPSGVFAFAAMGGTALAVWLLYLGGGAVAGTVGGSTLVRGLHGLKVALPYAALTFAGSFLLRFQPEGSDQAPIIHPSYVAALIWPLALAAAAGFVGGVRSEDSEGWVRLVPSREDLGRRLYGAVAGGWRMIAYGLLFSFVGLLVMAVLKPHSTAEYFSVFDRGVLDGVLAIVATLLVLPNMAAWVLFPAMGSCVGLNGPLSICVLSYMHFPSDTGTTIAGATNPASLNLPSAPVGYYLFLLIPLFAVVLGGMAAARRGRATSRNDAVVLGALAGVVFGLLSLFTIALASISVKLGGDILAFGASGSFRIGPDLTSGVLLALVWGVVGGALGGLWEGRALPRGVIATAPPAVPAGPPPDGPWATPQPPAPED